ncbi:MAG: cation diffusion facilitator family transporter, partial [Gammaproteobacteria bacterium]
ISKRPADARLHFGYRRTQVLAAFVNGVSLSFLLIWIAAEAVRRFFNPVEVDAVPMLVIAALGLAANAAAFAILHKPATTDLNTRGAMVHVVGDMLGSVAAVIAAIVIMLTDWTRIDPLLSFVVAALIARSAYRLLRDSSHILLEGAPQEIDVAGLKAAVKASAPEIADIHDVRIWQLTSEHSSITLHARIRSIADADRALDRIKSFLAEKYGIRQSTIQIELGEACPDILCEAHRSTARPSKQGAVPDHAHHSHEQCSDGRAALFSHK